MWVICLRITFFPDKHGDQTYNNNLVVFWSYYAVPVQIY